jgi:hypothetical protein
MGSLEGGEEGGERRNEGCGMRDAGGALQGCHVVLGGRCRADVQAGGACNDQAGAQLTTKCNCFTCMKRRLAQRLIEKVEKDRLDGS